MLATAQTTDKRRRTDGLTGFESALLGTLFADMPDSGKRQLEKTGATPANRLDVNGRTRGHNRTFADEGQDRLVGSTIGTPCVDR